MPPLHVSLLAPAPPLFSRHIRPRSPRHSAVEDASKSRTLTSGVFEPLKSTTQRLIANSDGTPPFIISMVKKLSPEVQQHVACALWHPASLAEIKAEIVNAGGIKPFISMLAAEGETAPKLAAIILVSLTRSNKTGGSSDRCGVRSLVELLSMGIACSQIHFGGGPNWLITILNGSQLNDDASGLALRSLLSVSESAAKQHIINARSVARALATSLVSHQLFAAIAQEHVTGVISGLPPLSSTAHAIKIEEGIDPLVLDPLSTGAADGKGPPEITLTQLAPRADASDEIATTGAVSAFIRWLHGPSLGPPEVVNNPMTKSQTARHMPATCLDDRYAPHTPVPIAASCRSPLRVAGGYSSGLHLPPAPSRRRSFHRSRPSAWFFRLRPSAWLFRLWSRNRRSTLRRTRSVGSSPPHAHLPSLRLWTCEHPRV